MKKSILFILLVLSVSTIAQKYVSFPTENVEWKVLYTSTYGAPTLDTTLLKYTLQGDTTINGALYHKLYKIIGTDANPQYVFSGGFREQDKKVYFYGYGYSRNNLPSPTNREFLLYDFNKGVGDKVIFENDRWYEILNIDSVKVGTNFRKRYEIRIMNSITSEFIIEGIGDVNKGIMGMITPILTCSECHTYWEFVSFSQNGTCVYKNPAFVDCNSTLSWRDIAYVPFPTTNATWREIHRHDQSTCEKGCIQQYKISGDTLINTIVYQKLYIQDDTLLNSNTIAYVGAIREQSKKIYFLSKYYNSEMRLYDFSKNVGDTLQNIPRQNLYIEPLSVNTIVKIDVKNINGSYRKVYYLDNINNSYYWIEGIGSTYGLLVPRYMQPTCYCTMDLVCYHQNNELIFLNSSFNSCYPIVDGITQPVENEIKVSPNPVKNYGLIQWSNSGVFTKLIINDIMGKEIVTYDISTVNEFIIRKGVFKSGLYFARFISNNGKYSIQKIIIQ